MEYSASADDSLFGTHDDSMMDNTMSMPPLHASEYANYDGQGHADPPAMVVASTAAVPGAASTALVPGAPRTALVPSDKYKNVGKKAALKTLPAGAGAFSL